MCLPSLALEYQTSHSEKRKLVFETFTVSRLTQDFSIVHYTNHFLIFFFKKKTLHHNIWPKATEKIIQKTKLHLLRPGADHGVVANCSPEQPENAARSLCPGAVSSLTLPSAWSNVRTYHC